MSAFVEEMRDLRLAITEARALTTTATEVLTRAERRLESAIEQAFEVPFNCTAPASDHRRAHRPGKPAKIDADPELQAFIRARINRLTFAEIAQDVSRIFPPARRVGKSAIHAWWTKNRSRFEP
ncbi:hypothetical protein [Roseovarius mucosus]|uniref:hypothetical protein n=1 Tax=Roseovarius mucosus TaxID=215743 RepID=UPI003F72A262